MQRPCGREPGCDDDTQLPPGFMDELRRLDREREASWLNASESVDDVSIAARQLL